jgi:hypothetical protein
MLRPREIHEMVEQARGAQTTEEWKQRYAIRAGVEATIHQATATTGIRRSRYLGLPKTHLAPRHHGYRDQPDPPGCLVDRNSTWPNTDQSPHHTRRLDRGVTGTIKN